VRYSVMHDNSGSGNPDPTSNTVCIGIDPGSNGGMAAIYPNYPNSDTLFTTMPDTDEGILTWLRLRQVPSLLNHNRKFCAVIEKITPHGFAGSGKLQTGKLYGSYRALCMALTAADIPYTAVTASVWHRALGIFSRGRNEGRSGWKKRLKAVAERTFPKLHVTLATADALLIARYCQLMNTQLFTDEEKSCRR
jgi:hypothetical protein